MQVEPSLAHWHNNFDNIPSIKLLIHFPSLTIFGCPLLTANFQKPLFCSKWSILVPKMFDWINPYQVFICIFIITRKIKLIYTLLIRCKFMCCSQYFTIYLLSLQNLLFFDQYRASCVILSICMLDWNSLECKSPLNDISMLIFWKTDRFPRMHFSIDFINENAIFLRIHVIVTL